MERNRPSPGSHISRKRVQSSIAQAERFRRRQHGEEEQEAVERASHAATDKDCVPCTYCGVVAQSVDHTVPRWLLRRAEGADINLSRLFLLQRWTVPSCIECNSSLGNRIFRTLGERRKFAHAHIRRKYASYLRIPNWTNEELAAVAPSMAQSISDALRVRDWVRKRLAWSGVGHDVDLSSVYDVARRAFGVESGAAE